jgi:hypothetical protein
VRRPDLAVSEISGPAQAYASGPVIFIATVRERNGDFGSRADCVLLVDNVPVDRANGIWVDANGAVSCQFAYLFPNIGHYQVAVALANVSPADWDLSNNSASTVIDIVPSGTPIGFGSLSARDEAYTYTFTATRTGNYPITGAYQGSQMLSSLNFFGNTLDDVGGPLKRVDVRVSADGREIYTSALTDLFSYRYDDGFAVTDCTDYSLNGEQAQSCTSHYTTGATTAWFFYAHSSGTVTYYGQTVYCNTFGCNTFTRNDNDVTGTGQRYGVSLGGVLRLELAFTDANDVRFVIDRSVTFVDASAPENYDFTQCAAYWDGLGQQCIRRTSQGTVLTGQVIW